MDATIETIEDEFVAIRVVDNQGKEHKISVNKDGSDLRQEQKEYPAYEDRTIEQKEMFAQAARYARYYIYENEGYEAFRWDENPIALEDTHSVLKNLSIEEFETYFEAYYESVTGQSGAVIPPAEIHGKNTYIALDLYLNEERTVIDTVSEIYFTYEADGTRKSTRVIGNQEPTPTARVELIPLPETVSLEQFHTIVCSHLLCQIRDYYVGMGEEPPEEYRVLGPGKPEFSAKYVHIDIYEDYDDFDTEIPGYSPASGFDIALDGDESYFQRLEQHHGQRAMGRIITDLISNGY